MGGGGGERIFYPIIPLKLGWKEIFYQHILIRALWCQTYGKGSYGRGGIAPNQVIARSVFEVH